MSAALCYACLSSVNSPAPRLRTDSYFRRVRTSGCCSGGSCRHPARHQLPASEVSGDPVTVFSVEAGPASARHWSPRRRGRRTVLCNGQDQSSSAPGRAPTSGVQWGAGSRCPAWVWDILSPGLAEVLGLELQWLENTVIVMKLGQRRGAGRGDGSGGEGDGGALIPLPAPPPWWWCTTLGSEDESSMLQPSRTADGSVGVRTVDSGVLVTRYPVASVHTRHISISGSQSNQPRYGVSQHRGQQNVFIKDECESDSSAVTRQPQDWLGNGDKLGALAKNSLQCCKCNTFIQLDAVVSTNYNTFLRWTLASSSQWVH